MFGATDCQFSKDKSTCKTRRLTGELVLNVERSPREGAGNSLLPPSARPVDLRRGWRSATGEEAVGTGGQLFPTNSVQGCRWSPPTSTVEPQRYSSLAG